MGRWIDLTTDDGHRFPAWEAAPSTPARGAIVVIQEIFGVNSHIRSVVDGFAADGYLSIAPALFQRVQPDFETGYTKDDIETGRALVQKTRINDVMQDLAAAVKAAGAAAGGDHSSTAGRVGIVGYCWGGTMSWIASARVEGLACAVVYYGGNIADFVAEQPKCPVLGHFGKRDKTPSPEKVRSVLTAHPAVEGHFYDAGHGFNCDLRSSFDADASRLARKRTLGFFGKHVG